MICFGKHAKRLNKAPDNKSFDGIKFSTGCTHICADEIKFSTTLKTFYSKVYCWGLRDNRVLQPPKEFDEEK